MNKSDRGCSSRTDKQLFPIYHFESDAPVHSVHFVENADLLLCGNEKGNVSAVNLLNYRKDDLFQYKYDDSVVLSIRQLDNHLAVQYKSGIVKVLTIGTNLIDFSSYDLDYYGFCKIDVSTELDGVLIAPKEKSDCEVYSLHGKKRLFTINMESDEAFQQGSLHKNSLGMVMVVKLVKIYGLVLFLILYESGTIVLWEPRRQAAVSFASLKPNPMAMDFDEDKCRGICGYVTNELDVFQVDDQFKIVIGHTEELKYSGVSSIVISPDKKVVCIGSWNGRVQIRSWKTFKPYAFITDHRNVIYDMCFQKVSNKCLMACCDKDCKISLWKLY